MVLFPWVSSTFCVFNEAYKFGRTMGWGERGWNQGLGKRQLVGGLHEHLSPMTPKSYNSELL